MPMYNFDPTDDLDDWENQLLEEERSLRPEADKVGLGRFLDCYLSSFIVQYTVSYLSCH